MTGNSAHLNNRQPPGKEKVTLVVLASTRIFAKALTESLEGAPIRLRIVDSPAELAKKVNESHADGIMVPAITAEEDILPLAMDIQKNHSKRQLSIIVVGLDDTHRKEASRIPGSFYIEIPYGRNELVEIIQRACRRRRLIALIDDSELVHKHTVPVLTEAGYEAISARDGVEGLRMIRSMRPDLVISDIEMPEKDGYELCREIKEDAELQTTPVVICSALGEAADMEKGFDAGADDYLVKPAVPEELLTRVRNLLAGLKLAGREKILLVEDSPPIRHMVADGLGRQGFDVETANDGMAGFEKAKAILPDLIITDYDMPEWTGFELVFALKKNALTRDIPVMMLTARQTQRDQAQMRAAGLTAYLVKPFSIDKCVALAERLLAERRLLDYKKASLLYLSKGTAEAAEAQAAMRKVGAERADECTMTVLFSDICGFTPLSTKKSPAEVVKLLNAYFDLLCPIILDEGGDIDKFIGDALMALFADDPEESGAVKAVRAALRMQKAIKEWSGMSEIEIQSRIGINTGPVVRGDIGSRHVRRDYTVIGDAVNRAQRFESMAPKGAVLISKATYELCKHSVKAEKIENIKIKGVDGPVTGYLIKELF